MHPKSIRHLEQPTSPEPNRRHQTSQLGNSDAKGSLAVLRVRISGDGLQFERLDDIAAAVLALHIGDSADLERQDAGRYAAHFRTLSQERALIKLQSFAEAVPVRFQEEFGDQVRADITYVAGQPLRAERDLTVPEYVDDLFEQLEAKELAEAAKWEGKIRTARREAALTFTPIWSSVTEKTSFCRCVLDLSLRRELIEQIGTEAHGDELREIHAALDVMALRKSLLAIHKNNAQRNTPDMVVPVSAHAIDNAEGWTEVLEQIRETPDAVRKHLILEIREDGGVTSILARVIAELTALNVRSIICMRWFGTISADIVRARPWGLAVDLTKVESISLEQWQWLDGVATFSGRIGAETFALSVSTAAVGQKVLEAGFHHLAGSAIHSPGQMPRSATRLKKPFQLLRGKRAA